MRRVLGLLLLAGSLAFLVVALAKTYHRLPKATLHVRPLFAVGAVLVVAAGNTLAAVVWRRLLAARGFDLAAPGAVRIISLSQLGKYLPGGFWQPLGWVGLAREAGIPGSVAAVTIAITMLLIVCAALVVGPVLLVVSRAAGAFAWLLLVVPASLALLHPRVLGRVLEVAARVTRRPGLGMGGLPVGALMSALGRAVPIWVIFGSGLALTASALHLLSHWALLTGAFAVAWAVGFLAIPVPGGLGIRGSTTTRRRWSCWR
jgi:glycosyltransferase 2 family protein